MLTRSRRNEAHRFPLLELPDDVLANIFQRCPPGSIAGFPLQLALVQVRLTGSVDPNWAWALTRLAARSPAVRQRLSRHLRSVGPSQTHDLEVVAPHLTALEELDVGANIPLSLLAELPTSLTKLCGVNLEGGTHEALCLSLLRLTALEELKLRFICRDDDWDVGGTLPRLRRLALSVSVPNDLALFAPNLEALNARLLPEDLPRLPVGLTSLEVFHELEMSLMPLTRLSGLRKLSVSSDFADAELEDLFAVLTTLTSLKLQWDFDDDELLSEIRLEALSEALATLPERLDISIWPNPVIEVNDGFASLQRLSRNLVSIEGFSIHDFESFPSAHLTRLTKLDVGVENAIDPDWVQALSRLPRIVDLDITVEDGQLPAGLQALTQVTRLSLSRIKGTANLSSLKHLTRLQRFSCRESPVQCLAALPDCLTSLKVQSCPGTHEINRALERLTALEKLEIGWLKGNSRAMKLPLLPRLTALELRKVPCSLINLGALKQLHCLRKLSLLECKGLDMRFLRQLGGLASLRQLDLSTCRIRQSLRNAIHSTLIPLLENVEVLADLVGVDSDDADSE